MLGGGGSGGGRGNRKWQYFNPSDNDGGESFLRSSTGGAKHFSQLAAIFKSERRNLPSPPPEMPGGFSNLIGCRMSDGGVTRSE